MAILRSKHRQEDTVSKPAVFFSLIFVAIGIMLGSVREHLKAFRPFETKVQMAPRLLTRVIEKMA